MANPQAENGHTKIANEILEQLVKTGLLGSELSVLLFIIRKTYGYQKKEDWISLTQFEKATNLSRPTVVKTLKNLVNRGLLVKTAKLAYSFEKDHEKWVVKTAKLVKHNDVASKDRLTEIGKAVLTHKRKKEITKEITTNVVRAIAQPYGNSDINKVIEHLVKQLGIDKLDGSIKWNRIYAQNLLKRMGNEPERVIKYINYALQDPFHRQNSTSLKYLYNNLSKIALKAKGQSESTLQL